MLQVALEEANRQRDELQAEVTRLHAALAAERERAKELWRMSCVQISEFDAVLTEKEEEVESPKEDLEHFCTCSHTPFVPSSPVREHGAEGGVLASSRSYPRRGKAPPVEVFTGEDPETRLEDWLSALQRTARWNGWTPDEILIQLVEHLKGRAKQEWNLVQESDKETYKKAVAALRGCLHPGNKVVAAQDFRYMRPKKRGRR